MSTVSVKTTNPRLKNPADALEKVDSDGTYFKLDYIYAPAESTINHIQGIARYHHDGTGKSYFYITHSDLGSDGEIFVYSADDNSYITTIYTKDGYNHPGGCQIIGDFLVVGIENGDNDSSYVSFYDLFTDPEKPSPLSTRVYRDDAGCGCAGITAITEGDRTDYVVAAYDNGRVDLYRSNGYPLGNSDLSFTSWTSYTASESDYSAINLVTDEANRVYSMGFRSTGGDKPDKDYVVLTLLDFGKGTKEVLRERFRPNNKDDITQGMFGVHFRWSGGLRIKSSDDIQIFSTQRNFVPGGLTLNKYTTDD